MKTKPTTWSVENAGMESGREEVAGGSAIPTVTVLVRAWVE